MQQWRDFVCLLKNERKFQIGLSALVIALLFLILSPRYKSNYHVMKANRPLRSEPSLRVNALDKDSYIDLVHAYRQQQKDLLQEVKQVATKLEKVDNERKDFEETASRIFAKVIQKFDQNDVKQPTSVPIDRVVEPELLVTNSIPSEEIIKEGKFDILEAFEVKSTNDIAPQNFLKSKRIAAVVSGCRARAKLISGTNAPTDGTPYPVSLELIDDVVCPNNLRLPLGNATLIAAAQGSLSDSRVLFRLSKLSMAYPSGRLREFEVDGWVVGEDGKRGTSGLLIDQFSRKLAGDVIAGTAQGIADSVASRNITRETNPLGGSSLSVTGDELEYSTGQGLSKGANSYAKGIDERGKKLIPHVEVLSGREVNIIFSKAFYIPDLIEELEQKNVLNEYMD